MPEKKEIDRWEFSYGGMLWDKNGKWIEYLDHKQAMEKQLEDVVGIIKKQKEERIEYLNSGWGGHAKSVSGKAGFELDKELIEAFVARLISKITGLK